MKLVKPMLLEYQEEASSDPEWLYEPKFNGIRLLVGNDHSYTRHGTITTSRFPELLFTSDEVLMDGELIAPGESAPDNFEAVMARFSGNSKQPIHYKAFDLLYYRGKNLTTLPIQERKPMLTEVVGELHSEFIGQTPFVIGEGETLFRVMKENNMEGMVAKKLGSLYMPGTRSKDWRKIINWTYQECVAFKVTFGPFTVQLSDYEGNYIGSATIGFTKEIRHELIAAQLPVAVKVKARGWTEKGKLRLPQIIVVN